MVDAIGSKAVTSHDRLVVPVAAATKPAATTERTSDAVAKQHDLSAIAFDFGEPSAAETERVDAVRRAVRNGTYPITPETIADRMLALKLYWNPNK
ncbi:flagellar biosynthesis anti-sigma factor FlgM [Sphingomonas glacialis]|uniref:Flagellar biosynthesis anti-sigma factor FlgM n=1 Tax=Sphingomonas glacialis TaxID=658225 RepID=A0A502FG42_9SPHN|nr:flagellar biosynthesis anti-sigma factor FlgM [Sphingomonas glacialis]TPG48266.1 flagellar biosynthesis anti-sigma factor FlgM [Sphingomonas glacialis]